MSTIIDNIKQHISNNRGKYGAVAGAGTVYGASQMPTINQAAFNTMAHGQNLALDAADKIGYGKDQLQKLGLENKISPNAIQSGNDFYNSKLGQYINPNSSDMVNAAEQSSGIYNKMQEAKAQAQEVVNQAQAQGQNYLDQGINYIKGLNPFHESTNNSNTIPIKSMLLEGYQPEVIVEAVHANHSELNKKNIQITPVIQNNRDKLAKEIRIVRSTRDNNRKYANKYNEPNHPLNSVVPGYIRDINAHDNGARVMSFDGSHLVRSGDGRLITDYKFISSKPRLTSSAKQ